MEIIEIIILTANISISISSLYFSVTVFYKMIELKDELSTTYPSEKIDKITDKIDGLTDRLINTAFTPKRKPIVMDDYKALTLERDEMANRKT
jgi:hypothetical protein